MVLVAKRPYPGTQIVDPTERRRYHSAAVRSLGPKARAVGWRKRSSCVYRHQSTWHISAEFHVASNYPESAASIEVKPLELDVVSNRLAGRDDGKALPKPYRALGFGRCWVPLVRESWWIDTDRSTEENVDAFLSHSHLAEAEVKELESVSFADWIDAYVCPHGRDDYGQGAISALVLEGRMDEALDRCNAYIDGRRSATKNEVYCSDEHPTGCPFPILAKRHIERAIAGDISLVD